MLNQSFDNFELLIICDPSSDNSSHVVKQYHDKRIKIFYRSEPGPGGYAARNLGIKNAQAEWITFLDADDVWTLEHLSKIENINKSYPEYSLVTASRIIIEKGVKYLDIFSSKQKNNIIKLTFYDYLEYSFKLDKPFHTNTVVFKKSLVDGFDLFPEGRTKRSGDVYAWVKLAFIARKFIWSNHIGTHLYKDIVGVSKLSVPTIELFLEMVDEIKSGCDPEELKSLKRYTNKLIKTAWLENSKAKVELKPLCYYLFWKGNFSYCLLWSIIALIPQNLIEKIRKNKKNINIFFSVRRHS